jgi:inhibitor of KinA
MTTRTPDDTSLGKTAQLAPLGDRAVQIWLGDRIAEDVHRRVRAVYAKLSRSPVPGTIELVPAYASVTVHYEPSAVPNDARSPDAPSPYARFAAALQLALAEVREDAVPEARRIEIPVCYGGDFGPDLDEVARVRGMSPDEVVRLHSSAMYRVYMLGFAPGFAYLGGLPEAIAMPRRSEPRTAVPAGTVGIAGTQTGVYPLVLPGGWQLIGRTPRRMFDARLEPPTVLAAGDLVAFSAITHDEFVELATK